MQPVLETDRLILRPFCLADADRVQELAGAKEVADVTANIPHPYPDGAAVTWIRENQTGFENMSAVAYAMVLKKADVLIGCVSVASLRTNKPELGYWLGVEYWNQGYCTEACKALLQYCSDVLRLKSVYGRHLTRNPASGEVMKKCGFSVVSEGVERVGFMTKEEAFKVYKKDLM